MLAAQSCLTLCNLLNCSLPVFSVHGILQKRILEWVAIPFSRGSSQPRTEPGSPALLADSLLSEPPGKPKLSEHVPGYSTTLYLFSVLFFFLIYLLIGILYNIHGFLDIGLIVLFRFVLGNHGI